MPKLVYRHTNIKGKEIACVGVEDDGRTRDLTFVSAIPGGCRFVGSGRYEKYVNSLDKPIEKPVEEIPEVKAKPTNHAWDTKKTQDKTKPGDEEQIRRATRVNSNHGVKMLPRFFTDCFTAAKSISDYEDSYTITLYHALVKRAVGIDPFVIGASFPKIEVDTARNLIKVWEKAENTSSNRPDIVIRNCLIVDDKSLPTLSVLKG